MSMVPHPSQPDDEGDFEIKCKAAMEKLEEQARKMGLYPEHAHAMKMPGPRGDEFVFVVEFLLGDVAFSDRVQNPQKYSTDTMVNTMEKNILGDTFLEERERIKRNLMAGRDALDDGDEGDG